MPEPYPGRLANQGVRMSIKEHESDEAESDVRSSGHANGHTNGHTNGTPTSDATPIADRMSYAYPGATMAPETVAIKVLARAHSITAVLEIPLEGAQGVIVSHGNDAGGYTLFVQDQYLHYVHNYCGALELRVVSLDPVPVGKVRVRVEFEPTRKRGAIPGEGMPGRTQLFLASAWWPTRSSRSPFHWPSVAHRG